MAFIPFKKSNKCLVTDVLFLEVTWEEGKSPDDDSELLGIIEGLDQQYMDFDHTIEESLPYVSFYQAELLFQALKDAYRHMQLKKVAICHLEGKEAVSEGEVFASPFIIDQGYQNLLLPLIQSIMTGSDFQTYTYQEKREYFVNQIYPAYKASLGILESALPLSTIVAQAGLVSADEITPTDPSQPATEVVTPTEPVPPVETPDEQPSQPTEPTSPVDELPPTDPTQPPTGDESTPTEPSQPSEQPTPSEPETKPEVSDKDTTPAVETPKEVIKTPTTPTEEAKAPQEGEVSKATGQVVSVVTPEAPIETNTGVSIVSTKEGKLILSDGSTVAPETVGAKTNDDKTITVTREDGSKATLPHTGEAKRLGLSLLGLAMAGLGLTFWKQKKSN